MTYGYRINLEQILLKRANEAWASVKEDFRLLPDADPITGESKNFYGPEFENDVVILACIDCILGWALSVESSINLIWITNEKTKNMDEKSIRGRPVAKFKELCRHNEVKLDTANFIADLKMLINVRDELVHFKKPITYVGFSFAPQYQHDFSLENMNRYQKGVHSLIKFLSLNFNMNSDFLDGKYTFFFASE